MEDKELREERLQEDGTESLIPVKEGGLRLDKGHEVIFRFPARKSEPILSLLKEAHFNDMRIAEIEKGELLLVYCRYFGDIKELDKKLQGLKSRAILTIGERRDSGIFDFFMSFADITPSSKLLNPTKVNQRRYFYIFLLVFLFMGVLFGWKTLLPKLASMIESKRPVRLEKLPVTYPLWNKFILPEFQLAWLKIKRDYNLDNKEMIGLFKLIKDIPAYRASAGQRLNDLTIYPEIIDRALGLLVLKNVKDLKELNKLFHDLELRFLYSQSFPDEKAGKYVNMFDASQFGNMIILSFYGDVLLANGDFTKRLLTRIRTANWDHTWK